MTRWLKLALSEDEPTTEPTKQTEPKIAQVKSVVSVVSKGETPVKAADLPLAPPTCAVCGVSDWRVSVTAMDGRNFHVECWNRQEQSNFSKVEGSKK
ncbi:MAG: hypothetical protein AAFX07_03935 [Pseudomonadota bacterium]